MPGQRQQGGEDSTNVQAGRDVIYHAGLSLDEVRQVALETFRANFLELSGAAAEVAAARAEEITEAFLERLERHSPESLYSASDPDMQYALFAAQREYARSGEPDLQEALIDLLSDRAEQRDRGLLTIVLNEAINSAPKLTSNQRRAIATCFFVRHTAFAGPLSVDAFYEDGITPGLVPIAFDLPTSHTAYQHIEYVGAGALAENPLFLGQALVDLQTGFFTRGFVKNEVFPALQDRLDDARIFIPCIRDDSRLQLAVRNAGEVDALAAKAGVSDLAPWMRQLLDLGRMAGPDVRDELVSRVPETAKLAEAWDRSSLCSLTLTSVGVAIGHGYWRRATGSPEPLDMWISE